MESLTNSVCSLLFMLVFLISSLPCYACAVATVWLGLPGLRGWTLTLAAHGWRLAFRASCWIRLEVHNQRTLDDAANSPGPLVVLANHTSLLDTAVLLAVLPPPLIPRVRMFANPGALSAPLFGTICRAMGHFPVPFVAGLEGSQRQAAKEQRGQCKAAMAKHLQQGGVGLWFPEGFLNPARLLPFQAGGLEVAATLDVAVLLVTLRGVTDAWPGDAPLGGRPARVAVQAQWLCRSSREWLAQSEAAGPREAALRLAQHARVSMQRTLDVLTVAPS
eukprot:EG_transcript_19911